MVRRGWFRERMDRGPGRKEKMHSVARESLMKGILRGGES